MIFIQLRIRVQIHFIHINDKISMEINIKLILYNL